MTEHIAAFLLVKEAKDSFAVSSGEDGSGISIAIGHQIDSGTTLMPGSRGKMRNRPIKYLQLESENKAECTE